MATKTKGTKRARGLSAELFEDLAKDQKKIKKLIYSSSNVKETKALFTLLSIVRSWEEILEY
ncbi:MAG: hypothetical protein NVS1B10_01360 [Candidatus Saccharimonadales bacterium]